MNNLNQSSGFIKTLSLMWAQSLDVPISNATVNTEAFLTSALQLARAMPVKECNEEVNV